MEQIRLVLAVVLSILVFLIWDFLFIPDPVRPPEKSPAFSQEDATEKEQPYLPEAIQATKPSPPRPEAVAFSDKTAVEVVAVSVDTNLYSLDVSEKGARLTRFDLKHYRETNEEDSPLKGMIAEQNQSGTLAFDIDGSGFSGISEGRYTSEIPNGRVTVSDVPRTISFTRTDESGLVVEKRYTFFPDSYRIGLDVIVKNGSDKPLIGRPGLELASYFSEEGNRFVFEGPCVYADRRLNEIKIKDISKQNRIDGALQWVAITTRYFMTSIMPDMVSDATLLLSSSAENGFNRVSAQYLVAHDAIAPGTMKTYPFNVFMGPKDTRILKATGFSLDRAVKFGWFDFVAKPCLWLMNWIYAVIPNYGVAIIILTLIIKLIFWPLGNKSYKSMAEMKKIQPLMMEIREKHKDDKKKMNEEMMSLYKTYKVNPLGGCLPMLVQIPVFIAFYRMLYQSIELRHAPFMLWINDLSAPERLFSFDVMIPLMQPPTGIPVLTILMGASMFLQQKLQPMPGDPTQAKIMMFMPLFLTVIFINFPSGLVLYFIVNNLVSIGQQYLVTRKNN